MYEVRVWCRVGKWEEVGKRLNVLLSKKRAKWKRWLVFSVGSKDLVCLGKFKELCMWTFVEEGCDVAVERTIVRSMREECIGIWKRDLGCNCRTDDAIGANGEEDDTMDVWCFFEREGNDCGATKTNWRGATFGCVEERTVEMA